jgi:hypothetical protein
VGSAGALHGARGWRLAHPADCCPAGPRPHASMERSHLRCGTLTRPPAPVAAAWPPAGCAAAGAGTNPCRSAGRPWPRIAPPRPSRLQVTSMPSPQVPALCWPRSRCALRPQLPDEPAAGAPMWVTMLPPQHWVHPPPHWVPACPAGPLHGPGQGRQAWCERLQLQGELCLSWLAPPTTGQRAGHLSRARTVSCPAVHRRSVYV